MSEDPRAFQRISSLLSVFLAAVCVGAFAWSWVGEPTTKWYFLILISAGFLNLLLAVGNFRKDRYRRNQKLAGFVHILGGLVFLALGVFMLICQIYS